MTSFAPSITALLPRFTTLSLHAASWVVAGIWEGLLLVLAVALALKLAMNISARIRFLLWTVTFAVLALLPFLHHETESSNRSVSSAIFTLNSSWSLAIAAIWIAASTFRLAAMLRETYRLRQIWKQAQEIRNVATIGSRQVQLCVSADVDRPSVIGFIAPKILIPNWLLDKLTPEELDQIVLHELEHLRRRDDWTNLLQKLSLALFPLNPVLLWIESRLCLEREMACDEGVLARTSSPHAYATCLTNLAEHSLYRRALSLSLGALELKSQLARRVYSILRRPQTLRPWQQFTLSAAIVGTLLGGAATLARCPQLVAFTPTQPSLTQTTTYEPPASLASPGTFGAHMVSLKAEMPSTTPKPPARFHCHTARHRSPVQPQPNQSNWLVLTSDDLPIHQHIVVTVFQYPYPPDLEHNSYAAVPTGTGWLLLQL